MNKKKICKITLLVALNGILAFFFIFFLKMLRNDFVLDTFLFWIHHDTKKFALYTVISLLLFLTTAKLQWKIMKWMEEKSPWTFIIGKYLFIFIISAGASFVINYLFQYFQHLKDPAVTMQWVIDNTRLYLAGVLYLLFVFLLTFALIGNIYISSLLTSFFLTIIGFIHYQKLHIRVEPLYPADYSQFGQLKEVIPMISEYISLLQILVAIVIFLVLGLAVYFLPKVKTALWMRALLLLFAITMVYSFTYYPKTFMKAFAERANVEIVKWNQLENYSSNGFLFGFISNLQNDSFEKPEDYTKEKVLETAEKYQHHPAAGENGSGQTPNIVFLMSETFWDPTRLNLQFSEDPLKHFRELASRNSSGYVLSPVFGGATANVEFEALTGFSTAFLKVGSIPFQDFVARKDFIPTIVSDLENKGYRSLAIHPYHGVFYKRNHVYRTFGIDKFLDMETMKHQKKAPASVISDESLSYEIIDNIKMEKHPLFIHAVSMQNHMPYNEGAYEENKINITGLSEDSTKPLEVYTEGIRRSDEALQLLADQLEQLDEPTVVVMWGDHLPVLGANLVVYKEAGYDDPDPDINNRKYSETPLLIYSNYELEHKNLETISAFYLGPIVYELSGLAKPPYYHLLDELREELAVIKADLKLDNEQQVIKKLSKRQQQLFDDYKLLGYDLLIGKQYSLDLLFPEN
ncbi:LTA synthase family protein [Bacillaceae bacterium Marseille-Q3522]|nr:LTA synthase family protein [Bacillaceae bacterium Marseille-Q3522]